MILSFLSCGRSFGENLLFLNFYSSVRSRSIFISGLCKVSGPSIYAIAGAHNIRRAEPSQQAAKVTFTLHPKFNTRTRATDLAIIKFESAFEINEYVKPIQMAPAADDETVQAKEKVNLIIYFIEIYF